MNFEYTENTPILINNKHYAIRFANGMTGIGARECWINEKNRNEMLGFLVMI